MTTTNCATRKATRSDSIDDCCSNDDHPSVELEGMGNESADMMDVFKTLTIDDECKEATHY